AFGKRSDYALLRKATVVALAMFAICSGLLLLDFDFDPNLTVHDDLHTLSEHVNAVNRSRESNSQSTSAADNSTADNSGDSSASVPSPETSDTAESTGIHVMKLRAIEGERWYGGVVQRGYDMPFGGGSWRIDFGVTQYNQASPVLVSSAGRYIWAESPYTTVWSIGTNGSGPVVIESQGSVVHGETSEGTLRSAYLKAAKDHFPASGKWPNELLFSAPQYNLWIEMMYDPTQEKVLAYAQQVLESGLPPGVIMIDTNWAEFYGSLVFHAGRFPDPAEMCRQLHTMGFQVMVWVIPFISPDSTVYREAKQRGYLVRNSGDQVAISEWWDGYSALVDFTNPEAAAWYKLGLERLRAVGVDGFKFDGGDPNYYSIHGEATGVGKVNGHGHTEAFARVGLDFSMSEYRACWKMGGTHLSQRLSDKRHFWDKRGVAAIIPNSVVQSLIGHSFTAPDMIGGGQYTDFVVEGTLELQPGFTLDQELFVRYCQAAALFPMMQFSLAPWKVLDHESLQLCMEAVELHQSFAQLIVKLAKNAAVTGEPIIRPMAYVFPGEGLEEVMDQFMLGDGILAAPVLEQGARHRLIRVPSGEWEGQDGAEEWEEVGGKASSSEDSKKILGPKVIMVGAKPYGKLCKLPYLKRWRSGAGGGALKDGFVEEREEAPDPIPAAWPDPNYHLPEPTPQLPISELLRPMAHVLGAPRPQHPSGQTKYPYHAATSFSPLFDPPFEGCRDVLWRWLEQQRAMSKAYWGLRCVNGDQHELVALIITGDGDAYRGPRCERNQIVFLALALADEACRVPNGNGYQTVTVAWAIR
ncbi:hypothetical protein CYMTET_12642, partial [Cymbomonas tetramitiformis]